MISILNKKTLFKNLIYVFVGVLLTYYISHRKSGVLDRCMGIITYPFLIIGHYGAKPFKPFLESRANYRQLCDRVSELEFENKNLLDDLVKSKAEQTYFGRLHDAFEFEGRYNPDNCIGGKIIEKNFTTHEHSWLLNKGSRDGVHNDMVAVFRTYLLGKVIETYPYHCKVTLLSDKTCKVAGYTASTKASGIVEGNNNQEKLSFSHVSHLEPLKHNDLIISSGHGTVFPEGFALGKIESYTTTDVCHNVIIKPIIDFTKLEFCVLLDRSLIKNY